MEFRDQSRSVNVCHIHCLPAHCTQYTVHIVLLTLSIGNVLTCCFVWIHNAHKDREMFVNSQNTFFRVNFCFFLNRLGENYVLMTYKLQ